jgi:hypothetical protein
MLLIVSFECSLHNHAIEQEAAGSTEPVVPLVIPKPVEEESIQSFNGEDHPIEEAHNADQAQQTKESSVLSDTALPKGKSDSQNEVPDPVDAENPEQLPEAIQVPQSPEELESKPPTDPEVSREGVPHGKSGS